MPGKCKFNKLWCSDASILNVGKWLREDLKSNRNAICIICNSTFGVEYAGIGAVRKHAAGIGHIQALSSSSQQTLSFAKTSNSQNSLQHPSSSEAAATQFATPQTNEPTSSSTPVVPIRSYLQSEAAIRAEILWAMDRVMRHTSLRDGEELASLFPVMFPDSTIASQFHMKKDKLAYMTTYGIGPYFQNQLAKTVASCPFFSVSFDESLNKVAQKGQMDLIVRFWDNRLNEVSTRYLTSTFLGHSTSTDLLKAFLSGITELGLQCNRISQISMDGPNVNFAFLKNFEQAMTEIDENHWKLIDIGSCSLHIIHGAYKYAHKKSCWKINDFLRSSYCLFKKFPSRRSDYTYYSKSKIFPKKMCAIRWVENGNVIECALNSIPHLKMYVAGIEKKPPQSNNFTVVSEFLKDDFLPAKLSFMLTITTELEPFLRFFQSNKPLLPYLYKELMAMLKNIMMRFIKKEIMDSALTSNQLMAVDVNKKENYKPFHQIDVGFGAKALIKSKNERDILVFMRESRDFMVTLCERLCLKSPLQKKIVKGFSSLSPEIMLSDVLSKSRINILLSEMVRLNQINALQAEQINRDYMKFCQIESVRDKLKTFNIKVDRLDTFFMESLQQFPSESQELQKFVQRCLVFFHGNADVERSFSVNSQCLVENLLEDSLISQRSIVSAVSALGGVENVIIDKALLTSVRHSSQKRRDALALKQQEKNKNDDEARDAAVRIIELKEKKKRVLELAQEEAEAISKEMEEIKKKRI